MEDSEQEMSKTAVPSTCNTSSSESSKEQQCGLAPVPIGTTGPAEAQAGWHRRRAGGTQEEQHNPTTPPARTRPLRPPGRLRRRTIRRRRRRRLQDLQNRAAAAAVATHQFEADSIDPCRGFPHSRRRLQSISQHDNLAPGILPSPTPAPIGLPQPVSNTAVRVLFRDPPTQDEQRGHDQQQRNWLISAGRRASDTSVIRRSGGHSISSVTSDHQQSDQAGTTARGAADRRRSISVADASRRLIERQIETMQEADSRRWNFDFRNCQPMNIVGHRYIMDCVQGRLGENLPIANASDESEPGELDDNNNNQATALATPTSVSSVVSDSNDGQSQEQPQQQSLGASNSNVRSLNGKSHNR